MKKFESLKWDSSFFKFKVAKIGPQQISEFELQNLLESLREKDFTLVYFYSDKKINFMKSTLDLYNGIFVDEKITYIKKIEDNHFYSEFIDDYIIDYSTDQMINLAIDSGVYSRFNIDKNIAHSQFEELYKQWIINSVNKKIAKNVIVHKKNESINGLITLGDKNGKADIGIIAVDSNQRGKGIGRNLIRAAEKWFYEHSYKELQVITQGINKPACYLYESCKFNIDKIFYLYHFWL